MPWRASSAPMAEGVSGSSTTTVANALSAWSRWSASRAIVPRLVKRLRPIIAGGGVGEQVVGDPERALAVADLEQRRDLVLQRVDLREAGLGGSDRLAGAGVLIGAVVESGEAVGRLEVGVRAEVGGGLVRFVEASR